jgi:predicted nuclease with RNAse H fold
MQSINLDALVGPVGEVVRGDVAHPVKPLDGAAYRALIHLRAEGVSEEEAFATMYSIAARVCPSLAETIQQLDLRQITAIVKLAGAHVEAMEQHPKSSKRRRGPQPPKRKA